MTHGSVCGGGGFLIFNQQEKNVDFKIGQTKKTVHEKKITAILT